MRIHPYVVVKRHEPRITHQERRKVCSRNAERYKKCSDASVVLLQGNERLARDGLIIPGAGLSATIYTAAAQLLAHSDTPTLAAHIARDATRDCIPLTRASM